MSLISRIDALPIRAKVLCGSFAYGYTEKGDEAWDTVAFRVGADVYRYMIPYWYLAVWEPCEYGSSFVDGPEFDGVNGIWQEVGTYAREEDYLAAFAEHVGDKPWTGAGP